MSDTFVVPTLANLGSPCYRSEQDRYNDFFSKTVWRIPFGITGVVVSTAEPSVENRDKVWFHLGTDGGLATPVPLVYSTDYARWVGRHPFQRELGYATWIWRGTLVELRSFDGGDGTAAVPTATTGAMWEADDAFQDFWPLGVSPGGTITTPGDTTHVFDITYPAVPDAIGVYFIRRTARIYYTV